MSDDHKPYNEEEKKRIEVSRTGTVGATAATTAVALYHGVGGGPGARVSAAAA